ncbi:hypothetical protein ESCO_003373 [Escovopsis weberi]|uniref:Ricin B lectin domain-containing protein n=1 Tax=Escovopsis weberi TaxID=150374 RepID=A0A0M8N1J3_ESCWE|nr:hypothetical protein ESCO_003373 [Escovopsis weberi]
MALQEGVYVIASVLSGGPVLDLENGNNPIANIIGYHAHGGVNQQWRVTRLSLQDYSIQSVYGNTWITAPADGSDQQLSTSRYDPVYNKSARWRIVPANGGYAIYSVENPSKVFDVSGGATKDLTPILLYGYHGGKNQVFTFKKV